MTGDKKHSGRGNPHPVWSVQTVIGSILMLASLFMLVPGINTYSAAVYTDAGGDAETGLVLLLTGGVVFLCALTLLIFGYSKYRAYMNRPRRRPEEGHALEAGDRPENPYDMPGRGFQTGIF